LAALYRVTDSTPPENIHDAPVTIGALVELLRRWEMASRQFEGRRSWLVIQRDTDEDGPPEKKLPQPEPRRDADGTTPDRPLQRRRLGLTWFDRDTVSPILAEKIRDEVVAVFLTRGQGPSEPGDQFVELATEAGRVLLGLLPPGDYDHRPRPPAYWAGFMFKLLHPRGTVKDGDGFWLIDDPFAAGAAVLRRSMFGYWCDPENRAAIGPEHSNDELAQAPTSPSPLPRKGKNIDGRMRRRLEKNKETFEWTAETWAHALKCSASTVKGTPKWRELMRAREICKADRLARRRGDGRPSDDG
jgi:hypothetical protein